MAKAPTLSGFSHIFDTEERISGLEEAERRLRAQVAQAQNENMDFMEWALRIPEPKFGTLNFDAFPFQRELYADPAIITDEIMDIQKCSQVGASAWLVRWAIYYPDVKGRTAFYVMPADEQARIFSNQRIKPLITRSEYLSQRVAKDNVNNVHERQIGFGFFNLAGSQSEAALETVDADVLALDEYDYLVQENIPKAEKRISGPLSLGLMRRIGFPTIPGYGINAKYEASDKRAWLVKCEKCNEWQPLDFWKNVDKEKMVRVCAKCNKPLDVKNGQWVAEHPERGNRGYHFTRLMVPNAKVTAIVAESKLTKPFEIQNFYNRTLGLPYVEASGKLSLKALEAAQTAGGYNMLPRDVPYTGTNLVTMGVDVASVRNLNVRVSEHIDDKRKRALWIGEVASFDELDTLMAQFRVNMCAIDHLPEGRLARSFAERWAGLVYLVSFATQQQRDVLKINDEGRHASVKRVEAMDATISLVRKQRNLLPFNVPEHYLEHMQSPTRRMERDEMDRVTVTYVETGPQDYFMCEVYDVVATDLFWYRAALDSLGEERTEVIDDHLEFQRASLDTVPEDQEYLPGMDVEHYSTGFEDES